MREILFRGKRVDIKEWVWGYYAYSDFDNSHYIVMMSEDTQYTTDNPFRNNNKLLSKAFKVIPETVGQYTGLKVNGQKVFEGDILFVTYNSPLFDGYNYETISYSGRVVYNDNLCMYFCIEDENRSDAFCALNPDEIKVIGNIHDNPELLEVEI